MTATHQRGQCQINNAVLSDKALGDTVARDFEFCTEILDLCDKVFCVGHDIAPVERYANYNNRYSL